MRRHQRTGSFDIVAQRFEVRYGSNSDLSASVREVRFAPTNGHRQYGAARLIRAISGPYLPVAYWSLLAKSQTINVTSGAGSTIERKQ